MSRKNNMAIRQRAREFQLRREKEEQQKKLKKQEKKQEQQQQQQQQMVESPTAAAAASRSSSKAKSLKTKLKAVKMKRNRVIRGIKVKDSESRKKIRELLAAEETMKAMKNMAVDGSDWETDDEGMQSE